MLGQPRASQPTPNNTHTYTERAREEAFVGLFRSFSLDVITLLMLLVVVLVVVVVVAPNADERMRTNSK